MTIVQQEFEGIKSRVWETDVQMSMNAPSSLCRNLESYHKMGLTLVPNLLSEITLFLCIVVRSSDWNVRYVYFDPLNLLVGSKTAHAYRNRSI